MDLKKYWKAVRLKESEIITTDVWLMSLENDEKNTTGGVVIEVQRDRAARNIVEGTHRFATPAEVETHLAAQAVRREAIATAELNRKQPINITLGPGTVVSRIEDRTEPPAPWPQPTPLPTHSKAK